MRSANIIITGANRGIGKEVARALAKTNNTIIMACRNIEAANTVCKAIRLESGNKNIDVMKLDLSSLLSILQFVEAFRNKHRYVNILINNAGVFSKKHQHTQDGFEETIGVNYFGTFLLTHLLLSYFPEGMDNRIINMTSSIYKMGQFKVSKLNDYRWFKAYAVSKYAILLFTLELADKLKIRNISANVVHPGIVTTSIMKMNKWYDFIIEILLKPYYISEEEGAKTSVYLTQSEEVRTITGKYYEKGQIKKIPNRYDSKDLRKELWDTTEKILSLALKKSHTSR